MASPNKPPDQDERQADLDRSHPFIEQGTEPPGRAVPFEQWGGALVWEGQRGWRTRHDQAVVRWDHGRPSDVFGALLPDGSRGDVGHTLDHGFRRSSSGEKRWIYGTIDIRANDVVFTDNPEQPVYAPPPPASDANLERDLANDRAFLTALKEDTLAHAVYVVFHNREFVRAADLAVWSCGDRQAARLVAGLRGLGESYHDYFLHHEFSGTWPDDRPRHEATLRRSIESMERALASAAQIEIPIGADFGGQIIENEEQAERARQQIRQASEESRPALEDSLTKLRQQLTDLTAQPTSNVMLSLRAHLTRLGWRTLNEADVRRLGEEAMRQGLSLLGDIKHHEARPASEPGAWWKEQSRRAGLGGWNVIASSALAGLTPDEQAVRSGLLGRINALAMSGRSTKEEYDALRSRNDAVAHRIGGYDKR